MMTGAQRDSRASNVVSTERYVSDPTQTDDPFIDDGAVPVSAAVRRNMQANRGRDTGPEMKLRSLLHAAGLRYRVNMPLPFDRRRRADLTFTRVGLFVFVDGCFWHGCPEHFVRPKTRESFWLEKIEANRRRDLDTTQRLEASGFTVIRLWEHESPYSAAQRIETEYRRLLAAPNPAAPRVHRGGPQPTSGSPRLAGSEPATGCRTAR